MSNQTKTEEQEQEFFVSKQGDIPFWDHPLMRGFKLLPKEYYPFLYHNEVLSVHRSGKLDEADFRILKVIGDAVAINENQLRRALYKAGLSYSDTSKRLDGLRRNGFVDRWKCRLAIDKDDNVKPPAPFTLGVAGYMLMRHLYNDQLFTRSEKWDTQGPSTLQRFVATNELKISLVEKGVLRKWRWNVGLSYKAHIPQVFGVGTIETPNGMINLLIERAQMSQNFVGFLQTKLNKWENYFEKHAAFHLNDFEDDPAIVVIYASTYSMASFIQKNIMLDTFSFGVWICVEEEFSEEEGVANSFYQPTDEGLVRINLPFLHK